MANSINSETQDFNFGFQTVLYYLEQADNLFYIIDSFEPMEPTGAYEGGMIIKAAGCVIGINLQREVNDFHIQVISADDTINIIMLPTGEDLLMFLLSLKKEVADSKYY